MAASCILGQHWELPLDAHKHTTSAWWKTHIIYYRFIVCFPIGMDYSEDITLMIFFKHPKKLFNLNITVNNNIIEQVDHFNYLGVTLHQIITWIPHLDKVSIKISHVTSLLRKLQHIFPKHILITSLIHSYLIYGLLVCFFWSGRNNTL